jgi:hypothetical protein
MQEKIVKLILFLFSLAGPKAIINTAFGIPIAASK